MTDSDDSKPRPSALQQAEARLSSLASTLTSRVSSTASSLTDRAAHTAAVMTGTSGSTQVFPAFDDLPKIPNQPQGCMWGYWDHNGIKDEIGSLNMLTPMVVKQAASEVKLGEHVQLDWSLENVQYPGWNRLKLDHKVISMLQTEKNEDGTMKVNGGAYVLDDEVHLNTQCGSQWDSLRHFGHQASGSFYNGLSFEEALEGTRNGIHNWCQRGGIVGRGVFVDWLRWYEQVKGTPPSPITRHEIPIEEIQEALRYQGTTTRPGDILIVRTGYVRWHNFATPTVRQQASGNPEMLGIAANEATVRWLYDQHFSAVAGDCMTFEAWPPKTSTPAFETQQKGSTAEAEEPTWCLHEW